MTGARRPEHYHELHHLLRLWRLRAAAYSDPGFAARLAAVEDAVSGQVLLFGGDPGSGGPLPDGTWDWTGTTWIQLSPALSPHGRDYGSMTYNSTSQQIVLFAGSSNAPESQFPAITWNWDGTTWHHAG